MLLCFSLYFIIAYVTVHVIVRWNKVPIWFDLIYKIIKKHWVWMPGFLYWWSVRVARTRLEGTRVYHGWKEEDVPPIMHLLNVIDTFCHKTHVIWIRVAMGDCGACITSAPPPLPCGYPWQALWQVHGRQVAETSPQDGGQGFRSAPSLDNHPTHENNHRLTIKATQNHHSPADRS